MMTKGVCAYNNDIILVYGGDLYTYRIPELGKETLNPSFLVNLNIADFEITGIECLSDERLRVYNENNTLIIDADDILEHRFNPNRHIRFGDRELVDIKSRDRVYEDGEYVFVKTSGGASFLRFNINVPSVYSILPLVKEQYQIYKYDLKFQTDRLGETDAPTAILQYEFILEEPEKELSIAMKDIKSLPKLDEGLRIKLSEVFTQTAGSAFEYQLKGDETKSF